MTSLIEERKDCLVILSKGSIDVVPLSSYSLLKHKYFNGLPISYAAGAGSPCQGGRRRLHADEGS